VKVFEKFGVDALMGYGACMFLAVRSTCSACLILLDLMQAESQTRQASMHPAPRCNVVYMPSSAELVKLLRWFDPCDPLTSSGTPWRARASSGRAICMAMTYCKLL
jgi:hypothetical protein